MVSADWAQSLVGRDWEIWWSDDNEEDGQPSEKCDSNTASMNGTIEKATHNSNEAEQVDSMDVDMVPATADRSVAPDKPADSESDVDMRNTDNPEGLDVEVDSEGEGSVIDDWYAGRVLSFRRDGDKFYFKIHFVGDENIYEMVLTQSKVRPSASGWIKRTKGILSCSALPSDDQLPPDTSMDSDQDELDRLKHEISSKTYNPIQLPKQNERIETPSIDDLHQIQHLRYLLRRQVFLRSRLAKIENHAGSAKYIDGEPNPTETFVNHLVQCCRDLEQLCDWFCHCWELLSLFFREESDTTLPQADSNPEVQLSVDHIVSSYYETGKTTITNSLAINLDSTVSKRRNPQSPPPQKGRHSKRRRTNRSGAFAEQAIRSSNGAVEHLLEAIRDSRICPSILTMAGKMIRSLCQFVLDPCIDWKERVGQLLGDEELDDTGIHGIKHETEGRNTQIGESDSGESCEEEAAFYSCEEIESALAALAESPVLRRLDWKVEKEALEKKLREILETETSALGLLSQITEENDSLTHGDDPILKNLESIAESVANPRSHLFNVNPIGKATSHLTREVLRDGLELRKWLVDAWHAEKERERLSFVEGLGKRLKELPDLSKVLKIVKNPKAKSTITRAKKKVESLVKRVLSIHNVDMMSIGVLPPTQDPTLVTIAGVDKALAKMKECPFILVPEEEMAIRRDVLQWGERALLLITLSNGTRMDFQQLETLVIDLQLILKGRSKTRMELLKNVHSNLILDREMERFGSNDVVAIHGSVVQTVSSLFSKASQWKLKAESIIDSLRMHGNPIAGESISTQKSPPMVDIKRISDLTLEYKSLNVNLDAGIELLEAVERGAVKWSSGLYEAILKQKTTVDDCLPFLLRERDLRPSGIIIDPTRHVYDSLVDVLTWYQGVKDAIRDANHEINSLSDQNIAESTIHQKHSSMTDRCFYPLLAEGIELVESFARHIGMTIASQLSNIQSIVRLLEEFGFRRSGKAVNLEKIQSHTLGNSILTRLIGSGVDEEQGFPLFVMVWYGWHLHVAELIRRCEGTQKLVEGGKEIDGHPSLIEAKDLMALQPRLEALPDNSSSSRVLLISSKTQELAKLECLVSIAESAENEMCSLLSQSKDLLKAGIQQAEKVEQHLNNLKQSYGTLKTHAKSSGYLSLDASFEAPIDHDIKLFTWLVRTFPYSFLYRDEASYNDPVDERVPWNILVGLYEKLPHEPDAQVGAFALVSLRIRELFQIGKKWQDEITRHTALTFRGGKRRAPAGNPKSEQDADATTKLHVQEMKHLAEHPILSKVAMPRETAVTGILRSSTDFETQLHNFLGQDYEGVNPDRASFPEPDSLVGKRGEFILYRLTGSPLFEELQARVGQLDKVAEHVLAETPGKATFEWIKSAVSWIEELSDAVSDQSPFKDGDPRLVLPSARAKSILQDGEQIFLILPDELKRTLSAHGIFVTTNKQDKTIRVTLKKDGAHHSCGGTVIRWCPVLFEALKADVRRLDNWEKSLSRILADFNAFFKATREKLKNDENIYTWFTFQEQVAELLEYGEESLVVSPTKPFVTSFQNLLKSLQNYLVEQSSPEKNQKFATKWLAEKSSVLSDRPDLLDALLCRMSIREASPGTTSSAVSELLPDDSVNRTFRDLCRSYIEKAFYKSLKISGISSLPGLGNAEDYCAMKAWEIEDAMYERFQGEYGVSRISEDYRDKARSLRWSLEAKNNVSLCFRILIGEIGIEELLDMSSEELASQKAKLDRAKAEQAAKSSALLTPGSAPIESSTNLKSEPNQKDRAKNQSAALNGGTSEKKEAEEIGAATINGNNSTTQVEKTQKNNSLLLTQHFETKESHSSDEASLGSPSGSPSVPLKAIAKPKNASRPPPPPSLLQSLHHSSEPVHNPPVPVGSRGRGKRFLNSKGGDRFRIEIVHLRMSFSAAFYLEDDTATASNSFVPEVLTLTGRLKIEELSRFLTDKISGGRWTAIPLRLTVLSDHDMKHYKTFYKEYEVKKRVAMFTISPNTKIFLVTPKFHGAAKATGYISLPHHTSTYAIVLTKEAFFAN